MANCNCKNGTDSLDFLTSFPGGTPANATYEIGLTHTTCGGRKMSVYDSVHPVICQLELTPIGEPVDLDNNAYCQECQIAGTVTYKPCGSCSPRVEYVSYNVCLPCSSTTSPTLTIGKVVASPKEIKYYQNNGCGCCQGTYPWTNQISITTSINVATA